MFGIGLPSENLIDSILGRVSEETLLKHYLGINTIPCLTNCPYRKDVHPSFGIYYTCGGSLNSKDFATGENVGGAFQILAKTWNTTINTALIKIWSDLIEGSIDSSTPIQQKSALKEYRSKSAQKQSYLEVTVREWLPHDVEYWNSYGISTAWLNLADVFPISYIHKKNIFGQKYIVAAEKYAYVYIERKEGIITKKIYQPFSEKHKWTNNMDKSVISLWSKIPETGDIVCICSSLKDALCLWANTGIPAIALQGEAYPMSNTAIMTLKDRYKHVYVCFDNDKWGLQDAVKFTKETGFTNIVLPPFDGGKDISDLYKSLTDKEDFKKIMSKLFINHEIW